MKCCVEHSDPSLTSKQAIAPVANARDHAVVVTSPAAVIVLSNGDASRRGVISVSRLGDQSTTCRANVVGLGSPRPPGASQASAALWIPGCVLGTATFPPGVGVVNVTLTFVNPDIFGGGMSSALLMNFTGNAI